MSEAAEAPPAPKPKLDAYAILAKAARRAGEGGLSGAAAMVIITFFHNLLRLIK
jgi:hypothetical protein